MLRTSRRTGVWQGLGALVLGLVVLSVSGCNGRLCSDPCDPDTGCAPWSDSCQVSCDPCGDRPPCDVPGGVNPGEAWCRVWVPPGYATKMDTVCVEPARQQRSWVPAQYGTRPKLVCCSESQLREKMTPAVWGVKTRERVVCPETEEWKRICCPPSAPNPCEVQMDCWTKQVKPAVTCEEDCPVCLTPERRCVEYTPPEYKVVEQRYLLEPGRWQYRCIPARYEQRFTQVCVQPGHWEWRRNEACEVPTPCAPCAPFTPCAPAPCMPPPAPLPAPLPAIQTELKDSAEGGEDAGIFAVGDTVRYDLRIVSDEGSKPMNGLQVNFTLPAELEFISGEGQGVTITGAGQAAATAPFDLPVGANVAMYVLCRVTAAPASGLVQLMASIKDSEGLELATETESTTLKPGS